MCKIRDVDLFEDDKLTEAPPSPSTNLSELLLPLDLDVSNKEGQ